MAERFEGRLEQHGSGTLLEVPFDVRAVFGKARSPVRGTVNGHPFRTTVAVYGGRYFLGFPARDPRRGRVRRRRPALDRAGAGRRAAHGRGPAGAGGGARREPEAKAVFDGLSHTHRREYVEWVSGAKREETRRTRLERAVAMLRDGVRHP